MTKERAYRENRRYWLNRWVADNGGPAQFGQATDTVDTYVIAAMRGRRNIGDDVADRIERKLGKEQGAMDRDPVDADGELVTDGMDFTIREYETGGSMGTGLILRDQPGVIHSWRVTPEWVQKNVPNISNPSKLAIVTGFGDSMRPLYNPGDPLLVDTTVKTMDYDGIYFFRVENEGFIKRLQRVPGEGLIAISENKAYKDWVVRADMDFEIFGRVVKAWKGEKF